MWCDSFKTVVLSNPKQLWVIVVGRHMTYFLKLLSQLEHHIDVQLFFEHPLGSPERSFRLVCILFVASLKARL